MKALTERECLEWLRGLGLPTPQDATPEDFFATIPFQDSASLKFTLPKDSGQKVALARALFQQVKSESKLLLWVRNWMVWPSSGHMPLVLRLRRSLGCERTLEETPGHLFDQSEAEDAMSFLVLSLEFIWDCLLVGGHRKLSCFVSHDEYLVLMSVDRAFLNEVGGVVEQANWCRKVDQPLQAPQADR